MYKSYQHVCLICTKWGFTCIFSVVEPNFEDESGLLISPKIQKKQSINLEIFCLLTLWQLILVKCIICVFNVIWTEILANKSGEKVKITNNFIAQNLICKLHKKLAINPYLFFRGDNCPA